jgi:hypothetical protein
MKLTIKQVESQLRSEGVALMKYNNYYHFWNMKEKEKKGGTWIGMASKLIEVLAEYKNYTNKNLHLEAKRRQDIINSVNYSVNRL